MKSKIPFGYQGSKLKELVRIKNLIGVNNRIFEPFLGSGIITGELGADGKCIGNELNKDVYDIWKYTKENNEIFFGLIEKFCDEKNKNEEYYYKKRDKYNEYWKNNDYNVKRTAIFYYLLNSCHSAMVRYGPNGFNTSYKLSLKKFNINDKIITLKRYSKKLNTIHNSNALELLKKNDLDVSLIYCDPPYINSVSTYLNNWGEDDYHQLIDLLKYQNRKNSIVSITSNYPDDRFDYLYDKTIRFNVTNRKAGTSVFQSEDILGIIGEIKINTIENFME